MYKLLAVALLGMFFFGGDPSIAELARKWAEVQYELADMRRTVCPD
jgi:hypothetical protein